MLCVECDDDDERKSDSEAALQIASKPNALNIHTSVSAVFVLRDYHRFLDDVPFSRNGKYR